MNKSYSGFIKFFEFNPELIITYKIQLLEFTVFSSGE